MAPPTAPNAPTGKTTSDASTQADNTMPPPVKHKKKRPINGYRASTDDPFYYANQNTYSKPSPRTTKKEKKETLIVKLTFKSLSLPVLASTPVPSSAPPAPAPPTAIPPLRSGSILKTGGKKPETSSPLSANKVSFDLSSETPAAEGPTTPKESGAGQKRKKAAKGKGKAKAEEASDDDGDVEMEMAEAPKAKKKRAATPLSEEDSVVRAAAFGLRGRK